MSQKTTRRTVHVSQVQTAVGMPREEGDPQANQSPLTPTCASRLAEKQQLQHLNDRLAQYIDRVRSLETENQRLSVSVRTSEESITRACNNFREAYEKELAEARRLCDELSREKSRLQRTLLEGEEKRLHLTPSPPSSDVAAPKKQSKRRRLLQGNDTEETAVYESEAGATGELQISDHDVEGRYVMLFNKGDREVTIGGWSLKRKAGGTEVTYKFHPKIVLKPNKKLTVWSSDSQVRHSPPFDFVMKNQKWPVGKKIHTSLLTPEEEEVAWRQSIQTASSQSLLGKKRSAEMGGANSSCVLM